MTDKYWELIINVGVNVQKGQKLVINALTECAEDVRMAAEKAYDAGAKQVITRWSDDGLSRINFMRADDSVFDIFEPWEKEMVNTLAQEGAAFLTIHASDPECFKDTDPNRVIRSAKAKNTALKDYRERIMTNRNRWCVVSVPTLNWARKVFPDSTNPVGELEKTILRASRADCSDVTANWINHTEILKKRCEKLNACNFKYMTIRSGNGTDLSIGLPEGHVWEGGMEKAADGVIFSPNIPTEEIFTCPHKTSAEGIVKSSRPFVYQGNIIDGFTITFEKGRAVDIKAEAGGQLLEKIIATDENAAYLGELALVPYHSPISELGILFYNTLFDENAACHLAFGEAYPRCVANATGQPPETLSAMGVNKSKIHEDFMIGTSDMEIVGITYDNKRVKIFENGDFAF